MTLQYASIYQLLDFHLVPNKSNNMTWQYALIYQLLDFYLVPNK